MGKSSIRKIILLMFLLFTYANMLYLETPIGVGFSYSIDTSSYEAVGDKITGMFHSLT